MMPSGSSGFGASDERESFGRAPLAVTEKMQSMSEYFRGPSASSKGASESNSNSAYRQAIVEKINEAINTPGFTPMKKLVEVENILFPKSCSEKELKNSVSKLITYVQDIDKWNRLCRKNKHAYRGSNMPSTSKSVQDEIKERNEIESFINLLEKLTL